MTPSNVVPVRWRATESRRCASFAPLADNHPLVVKQVPCVICNELLAGSRTQLLAVGPWPGDEEDEERHSAGRWYAAMAVVVHERCLTELSSDQVEELVEQLEEVIWI